MDRFLDWMERYHLAVTISVIFLLVLLVTSALIAIA